MRVVPEINIMNGHCVKQLQGMGQYSEIVSHSPRKIAKMWEEQGASFLHIRDLDGIMTGHITNHEAIKKLIDFVSIPVEIYGGIYSLKEIENILNFGAVRVVLGLNRTNFNFLKEAVNSFGADKIAVNIEENRGLLGSRTSEKFSIGEMVEMVKKVMSLGITDFECEGIFQDAFSYSTNLEYLKRITDEKNVKLIISGGITTIKELELVHNAGIYGVILDDALYERRIELKNAIELFEKGVNSNEL